MKLPKFDGLLEILTKKGESLILRGFPGSGAQGMAYTIDSAGLKKSYIMGLEYRSIKMIVGPVNTRSPILANAPEGENIVVRFSSGSWGIAHVEDRQRRPHPVRVNGFLYDLNGVPQDPALDMVRIIEAPGTLNECMDRLHFLEEQYDPGDEEDDEE